ncbi:putative lactoylglutathione lyase [Kockovaella imperatae]|uniref:lactoylglutathione lyase n=1 Tax=Kockovaella imperatae TaxID=4999 RepID=A0A1Y1URM8_9TREE|nr:putative lactoylglutathione lyase [Kockovaella imperatae]ORX40592.1 putative lactoylglutathione lyase [Kockovaella imperatae]
MNLQRSLQRIIQQTSRPLVKPSIATTPFRMSSTATDVGTYKFNHTMFRIKDPKVSIPWYEKVLGMELINESPGGDFTNYFLAYPSGQSDKVKSQEDKKKFQAEREGVLELCHNWGTESDSEFKGYANGNSEPGRGFGHICVAVDNLEAACKRFDELGVNFKKRPEEGKMRHIAFILDPDGYWVEIIAFKRG